MSRIVTMAYRPKRPPLDATEHRGHAPSPLIWINTRGLRSVYVTPAGCRKEGGMSQELEHFKPGEPAPATGAYEEHNVFGSPTGNRIDLNNGDPMPLAPRGFTWRRVKLPSD